MKVSNKRPSLMTSYFEAVTTKPQFTGVVAAAPLQITPGQPINGFGVILTPLVLGSVLATRNTG